MNLEMTIKKLGSAYKFRVGRATGNEHIFLFGLIGQDSFLRLSALVNLRENKVLANKKCFTVLWWTHLSPFHRDKPAFWRRKYTVHNSKLNLKQKHSAYNIKYNIQMTAVYEVLLCTWLARSTGGSVCTSVCLLVIIPSYLHVQDALVKHKCPRRQQCLKLLILA